MAEIVQLRPDKPQLKLPAPKSDAYSYAGQRYIISFKPDAPPNERWSWEVKATMHFVYSGTASTQARAITKARRKIMEFNGE